MALARSPLAPASLPELKPLGGVTLAAANAQIRYKIPRDDLMLAVLAEGTSVAGVFTQSATAAAPVGWCRKALKAGKGARALLVNAGNANAFTGKGGEEAAAASAKKAAELLGCAPEQVFVSSTGVIGEPLPVDKILSALPALHKAQDAKNWTAAAEAIRTTDTFGKTAVRSVTIGDKKVTIQGIAKGSGMIAPNMATMLAYMFTDAKIGQEVLQHLLAEATKVSFNAITVDSDTSTNDTLLAFATGAAGNDAPTTLHDPDFHAFRHAFIELAIELAQLVVRDGEGAKKFITVRVSGAKSDAAAHVMAMAIANSPLVKTAIAGEDPNWGRLVMAVGKSGEEVDVANLSIAIGDFFIARDGARIPGYDETPVKEYMKGDEIALTVEVGLGVGKATVWTCDLTHGYIDINADYRS